MKTKTIFRLSCTLFLSLLIASKAMSQQTKFIRPEKPNPVQMANTPVSSNYTYKLFVAPNKIFGYDIFRDGRIIFHQPALAEPAGYKQASLNKKLLADKAAAMAIEKIKNGSTAELTRQELMLITH